MDINKLYSKFEQCSIYDVGASADMLWINVQNKYAIDIQSQFRIISNSKIILANGDLYYDKDVVNKTITACKNILNLPCKIIKIENSKYNDLKIYLKNNVLIETFTNSTEQDDEQWRIFERHNNHEPHYVAYPYEICKE